MNRKTKITLGLCAVKVGLEATKYISEKWGSGKMKKYINDAEKYINNIMSNGTKVVIEVAKQTGECAREIIKQKEETAREIVKIEEETEKEIVKIEEETEKEIVKIEEETEKEIDKEIVDAIKKFSENSKNDKLAQDFYKLLVDRQENREKTKQEIGKEKEKTKQEIGKEKEKTKQEKEKTKQEKEKTKRIEFIGCVGLGGIAITGILFLAHEYINNRS